MNRRTFLNLAASSALPAAGASNRRPNFLIVMADQHRAGLTRATGGTLDTMPALDRLAASGASFDRAYTPAPLCVPARVSMLTGRWPHAHRVRQNSAARFASYSKDLFDVAREAGYKTGLAGKNHSHLTAQRVDFFRDYGHLQGSKPQNPSREQLEFEAWMMHLNHGVAAEPSPHGLEVQFPYRIVSDAIEFIQSAGDNPYALWVSFPEPHNPYQVPKPYFDMFPPESVPPRTVGPEVLKSKGFKWEWLRKLEEETYPGYDSHWRRTRSNYLGMLRLIDDQIDRLLKRVDLANTVIVYLTDHGDFFCDYGLIRKGVDLPEALTRIPMIWAGPGIRPQSKPAAFVSTADLMPTICEAMGAPIPPGAQGRSLWPMLQGGDYPAEEFRSIYSEVGFGGMYYDAGDRINERWGRVAGPQGAIPTFDELNPVTQSGNLKMVRMGDWKLTFDMLGNGALYNLAEDPYELRNLYGTPSLAQTQSQLTAELLAWTIRTQDDLPTAAYATKWPQRNWYATYRNHS
jgi:arylsulfatase A-like enzyme